MTTIKFTLLFTIFALFSTNLFSQTAEKFLAKTWVSNQHAMMADFNANYSENDRSEAKQLAKTVVDIMKGYEVKYNSNKSYNISLMGSQFNGSWALSNGGKNLTTDGTDGYSVYDVLRLEENMLSLRDKDGLVYHFIPKGFVQKEIVSDGKYVGQILTYSGAPISDFKVTNNGNQMKLEIFSLGVPSTICDCHVDESAGYKRGLCVGNRLTDDNMNYGYFTSDEMGDMYFVKVNTSSFTGSQHDLSIIISPTMQSLERLYEDEARIAKVVERFEADFGALRK